MQSMDFTLTEDNPEHPAIGLIVLQSDETMEHELRGWLPDHYRLFHTRIPNQVDIHAESLDAMQHALPASTRLLPQTTDFSVIVYGCTSASTVIGEEKVASIIQAVFPKTMVTNPLTAIKAQLQSHNAKRIALLTPYVPEVSQSLIDVLEQSGISVVNAASFFEGKDNRVARISAASITKALKDLAQGQDIDAIVASCTNLRTAGLLEKVQTQLGIPVLSSNSSLAWHIQTHIQKTT